MSQSHSAADGHTRDCKVRREALWLIPFGGAVLGHTLDQNSGLESQRLSAAEGTSLFVIVPNPCSLLNSHSLSLVRKYIPAVLRMS